MRHRILISLLALTSLQCNAKQAVAHNSKVKEAIDKGVLYVNNNCNVKGVFLIYPLLLLLKEQKKLNLTFNTKELYLLADTVEYNFIKPVVAFGSQDSSIVYPVEKIDSTNYLTRLMYYCFNYPLVNDTSQISYYAKKLYKSKEYDATHCYFSLTTLLGRNTFGILKAKYSPYLNVVRKTVMRLAENTKTNIDLRIEAIAMISEESIKNISKVQIEYIINNQNADGSWHNLPEDPTADKLHTTAFALWSLANWLNK